MQFITRFKRVLTLSAISLATVSGLVTTTLVSSSAEAARTREVSVGRTYYGTTMVDLDSLLWQETRGAAIREVYVTMSSPGGRSHATLHVNGRPEGATQVVQVSPLQYTFRVPRPDSRNRVELLFNGQATIRSISADITRAGSPLPPGGILRQQVRQNFPYGVDFDLDRQLGLGRYTGAQVESVTVGLRTNAARAQASIVINGRAYAPTLVTDRDYQVTFRQLGEIGRTIRTLGVQINGDVYVDYIEAKLR